MISAVGRCYLVEERVSFVFNLLFATCRLMSGGAMLRNILYGFFLLAGVGLRHPVGGLAPQVVPTSLLLMLFLEHTLLLVF